jgi:hypothetical protein
MTPRTKPINYRYGYHLLLSKRGIPHNSRHRRNRFTRTRWVLANRLFAYKRQRPKTKTL